MFASSLLSGSCPGQVKFNRGAAGSPGAPREAPGRRIKLCEGRPGALCWLWLVCKPPGHPIDTPPRCPSQQVRNMHYVKKEHVPPLFGGDMHLVHTRLVEMKHFSAMSGPCQLLIRSLLTRTHDLVLREMMYTRFAKSWDAVCLIAATTLLPSRFYSECARPGGLYPLLLVIPASSHC